MYAFYSCMSCPQTYYFLLLKLCFIFQIWCAFWLFDWFCLLIGSTSLNPLRETPSHFKFHTWEFILTNQLSTLDSQVEFTLPRESYRTKRLGWPGLRFSNKENWSASRCHHHPTIAERAQGSHLVPRVGGWPAACTFCSILYCLFYNKWNSEYSRKHISHMAVILTLKLK